MCMLLLGQRDLAIFKSSLQRYCSFRLVNRTQNTLFVDHHFNFVSFKVSGTIPVCFQWTDETTHVKWISVHTDIDTRKNVCWQRQRRQKVKWAEILNYSAVDVKELFALKTLWQPIKVVTFPSKAYGKKACDILLNLWRAEFVGSYALKSKLWHSLPLVHQIQTTSFVSESSSFVNFWVFWEYSREMLINACSVPA